MRARTIGIFWLGGTLGVLAYAAFDLLWWHPQIQYETRLIVTPDLSRIMDLAHWGGRLIHHGRLPLLIANAIIIGGLLALVMTGIFSWFQKRRANVERYISADKPTTLRSNQIAEPSEEAHLK